LCSGFFAYHYSDISSEVKYRLSLKSPDIRRALSANLVDEMSRLGLRERVIVDIESTYSETSSKERELIRFAKSWASYYEVASNSVVYPEAYTTLLASMRETIETSENQPFLAYLDLDMSHTHTQGKYLLTIHRLASSYRWNRMNRQYPISVLSHLTLVTYITYLLGIEAGQSDREIDAMLEIALYHDIPEAITGDIITPTKKAIP
jgi:putative hydrolase of HD superfamily